MGELLRLAVASFFTCRRFAFGLLLTGQLAGCVGGTLSDTTSIEMLPLRSANEDESPRLKRCLQAAHEAQENHRRQTGKYFRRARELPVRSDCKDFLVSQLGTPTGYEIRAEIREDEHAVRWSVNEKGVIEEHLDPEESEPELEL